MIIYSWPNSYFAWYFIRSIERPYKSNIDQVKVCHIKEKKGDQCHQPSSKKMSKLNRGTVDQSQNCLPIQIGETIVRL